MKSLRHIILAVVAMIAALSAMAELPTEGDWPETTISINTTVILTGDVNITGTITVSDGATLTIRNGAKRDVTMSISCEGLGITPSNSAKASGLNYLFYVNGNSELEIAGSEDARIIVDGSNNFTWRARENEYTLTAGKGALTLGTSAICSLGTVALRYVTVQNFSVTRSLIYVIDYDSQNSKAYVPGTTTIDHVVMTQNKTRGKSNYGGCFHFDYSRKLVTDPAASGLYINDSEFTHNEGAGGVLRTYGQSRCSVYIVNSLFEENYSYRYGGALFWNAHGINGTVLSLDGCQFNNNLAMDIGGAVSVEANIEFVNNQTTFSGNRSLSHGGAMCIWGYTYSLKKDVVDLTYMLNKHVYMENNTAENGGGMAFVFTDSTLYDPGSTFKLQIKDAVIKNNKALSKGGGIYFHNGTGENNGYTFDIDLYSGTIDSNTAPAGGGIYADNAFIDNTSSENRYVVISNNTATDGGGGGIFMENGSMNLNGGTIINNTCTATTEDVMANGGGVCLQPGTVTLANCTVSGNSCKDLGGGIFGSYTKDAERGKSTFSTGEISNNTAGMAGGGVCVYGYSTIDLDGVAIRENTAANGGGIYVRGVDESHKAKMTYSYGLIIGNKAVATSQDYNTAYETTINTIEGIGGGLYMGRYSDLHFDVEGNAFGIYDNTADVGADDIYATGICTSVLIPHVEDMNLSEMAMEASESSSKAPVRRDVRRNLFWVEDYVTNDINYDKGTYMKGDSWLSDPTNQRYRQVRDLEVQGRAYHVSAGREFEDYLSLTIASSSIVILEKAGMEEGENVIFRIYRGYGSSTPDDYYLTVTMTERDREEDGMMRKYVTLEDGVWTIVETPWSWAYEGDQVVKTMKVTLLTPEADRVLNFTNRVVMDAPTHAEGVVVNQMKVATPSAVRKKIR